jgi:hypothetical protein
MIPSSQVEGINAYPIVPNPFSIGPAPLIPNAALINPDVI